MGIEISCVVDAEAALGEATVWDPRQRVLWWIDIWGQLIHRYDPATGSDEVWTAPEALGCLGLRAAGGLVLTMASGFYFFDPESGRFDPITDPEAAIAVTRFNDGKTDRQGRFWSGSMFEAPGQPRRPAGSLWRLDADLSVHRMISGIGCSNGLAWSPDSRVMYFSDSHTPLVRAYDFDAATGDIANERLFIDVGDLNRGIDGATVDADGCYWATLPFGGRVCRFDPGGRLMQTVALPTDLPTCCEFGGPDLDILYVTTAVLRRPLDELEGQQHPGGLFAIEGLGIRGLPLPPFPG